MPIVAGIEVKINPKGTFGYDVRKLLMCPMESENNVVSGN